jgi:hypothetical protein
MYNSHLEYFSYAANNDKTLLTREAYTVDNYAPELRKKVKLVGHFHEFMNEHLYLPQDYTFVDINRTSRLDCMSKYVRTRYGVLFRLSNRIVQVSISVDGNDNDVIISYTTNGICFITRLTSLIMSN